MPQGRLLSSQHRSEHRCLPTYPLTTCPCPCPHPLAWRCRSAEAAHAEAPLGRASTTSHTTDTTRGRRPVRRMATAGWVGCPECPEPLVVIALVRPACILSIPALQVCMLYVGVLPHFTEPTGDTSAARPSRQVWPDATNAGVQGASSQSAFSRNALLAAASQRTMTHGLARCCHLPCQATSCRSATRAASAQAGHRPRLTYR